MKRRDFFVRIGGLALAAPVAMKLAACGDDGGGNDGKNDAGGGGAQCSVTIQNPHGHVMNVAVADVMAGADKTYDITGAATHPHNVTLKAADFTTLNDTGTVEVRSTIDASHDHVVTVTCTGL